jgi:hypothetical protein
MGHEFMERTRSVYKIWVGQPRGKCKAYRQTVLRWIIVGRDEHFSSVTTEYLHG